MSAKSWLAPAIATTAALTVAMISMPNNSAVERRRELNPEYAALQDSAEVLSARRDTLRRLFIIRNAELRAEAVGATPNGLRVVVDAGVPAATAERFERFARQEAAELVREFKYPVVLVMQRDSLSATQYRKSVVAPRGAGRPCVVIVRLGSRRINDLRPHNADQLLGPCGLYARFGAPGEGMRRWLVAGGLQQTAAHTAAPRVASISRDRVRATDIAGAPTFGACLVGHLDRCEDLFAGRYTVFVFTPTGGRYRSNEVPRGAERGVALQFNAENYSADAALSGVRRDLGDERFAAMWLSESEPREAFEALEGQPLGALIRDQFQASFDLDFYPGPMRPTMPLLALMLAGVLAGGALALSRRRYE